MKFNKHIYKLIFSLILLMFILFPANGKAANSAETQINTQQAVSEANAQYNYFDFSKFQYTGNITSWNNFIENIDSDKKDTYSKDDDYDHFESSKPIKDLYPLIKGTVIINTTTDPDLFTKYLGKEDFTTTFNTFVSWGWDNIKTKYGCQDFNYYFGIYKTLSKNYNSESPYFLATDVNLKYYHCLYEHLESCATIAGSLPDISSKSSGTIFANNSLQFIAGMKKETSNSTSQTSDYWNNNFKSSAANKAKADLSKNEASKKMASGACYEANPSGNDNRCANVISKNCPDKTADGKGKMHFLYGITCEDLNTIIKDDDYHGKIIKDFGINKDDETPAALKDKIEVKIQVPFDKIKDGIDLPNYINAIYEYLIGIGLFLAGFMLILGGIQYIGQQPANGKKNIKNAVIGIILLSGSYTLLQVINPNTLNLKDISNIKEIKRDVYDGRKTLTSSKAGKLNIDCNNIPGPDVKPSNETPPGNTRYNFNAYKKTKGFNPMCVLSDKALKFDSEFTAEKMQTLFEQKNSILAVLKINDKKVSTAIFNIAKSVDISQQLLLTILHKEQSLISTKRLKTITDQPTLSKLTSAKIKEVQNILDNGKYSVKYRPLFVAMGYGWRDGDNVFMPRTASEIDAYLKKKGVTNLTSLSKKSLNSLKYNSQKNTLSLASGYLQAMEPDLDITNMTWGERYVRGRLIQANKKLAEYFGEVKYDANTKAIDAWGGLGRQIYLAARIASSSGRSKLQPLDYIGAPASAEASGLRHSISQICTGNRMTAILYSYTPHVSAQKSVFYTWKSLGFDQSYLFPIDECGGLSEEWKKIGQ